MSSIIDPWQPVLAARTSEHRPVPREVPFELDPFVIPAPSATTGAATDRLRCALQGWVGEIHVGAWRGGGPVLEATLDDGSGPITLAYLGRRHAPGMTPGTEVVAVGTVYRRHGRRTVINPQVWVVARSGWETNRA